MISIADGIGLLIGIVLIAIVADRLRIAYPILLVVAGIGVALLPLKHRIELATRPRPVGLPPAPHLRRFTGHVGA